MMTREEMMKKLPENFFEKFPELVNILTPELYEEFGKVPPTVEGIMNFLDTHNDRQARAFYLNTTPEQQKAFMDTVDVLLSKLPRL